MELSQEDVMRLHVLLVHAKAVRIDESTLCVHGLTQGGEVKVQLHPTGNPDIYLRLVREMLSTQVLGSPRGYPVYLRRWTRMGQIQTGRLDPLLMLGEPEAATAVACSPGLTPELAEKVWWVLPTSEIARYMLMNQAIARSDMGRVLALHLFEHLPFEQEPIAIIETIRLILQPGLLKDEERRQIWDKGRRKNAFYVGFLQALPDDLPEAAPQHPKLDSLLPRLAPLEAKGNPFASQLKRLFSGSGQAYLKAAQTVLQKPIDQDVVVALLEAIRDYFSPINPDGIYPSEMEALLEHARQCLSGHAKPKGLSALMESLPEMAREVQAMLILAQVGEPLVRPIFARTTAIGSLMRKKIEPITGPLLEQFHVLQARPSGALSASRRRAPKRRGR